MRRYTIELLEPIIRECYSFADVMRKLNIPVNGGNHRTINKYVELLKIDTSHFTGISWSKGKDGNTDSRIKRKMADEILLYGNMASASILRRSMIEKGVKYVCSECGIAPIWNNKPLTLHIDHVNGKPVDNRLDNLRFLCPNCHQQTDTWGNKKNPNKYKCLTCDKLISKGSVCRSCTIKKYGSINRKCPNCNGAIALKSKLCFDCYGLSKRKVKDRPSKELLLDLLKDNSYLAVGKMYGVSDNAIRKWLK